MKKILLSFSIVLIISQLVLAQSVDTYIFKVENGKSYTPLTTSTNLTSGFLWDEENYKVPLGFTADIGGKTTNHFSFSLGYGLTAASDTIGVINSFIVYGADLIDRGILTSTPSSPVRYVVFGSAPKRIFKLEYFNAGFFQEFDNYHTNNDSVNFQVWLYETSNIVEFRYGTSKISHASEYFDGAGAEAPLIGYLKNFKSGTIDCDQLYHLRGIASAPNLDSTTNISDIIPTLSSPPVSGTVYRFIPKAIAASIGEIDITQQLKVYPTIATAELTIDYNSNEEAFAEVLNLSGQLIDKRIQVNKGRNEINVTGLPSGNYLIRVSNTEGNAVFKFVKQ